jgi:hypothetical protein
MARMPAIPVQIRMETGDPEQEQGVHTMKLLSLTAGSLAAMLALATPASAGPAAPAGDSTNSGVAAAAPDPAMPAPADAAPASPPADGAMAPMGDMPQHPAGMPGAEAAPGTAASARDYPRCTAKQTDNCIQAAKAGRSRKHAG